MLADQPTKKPVRKVVAASGGGGIGGLLGLLLARWISDQVGGDIPAEVTASAALEIVDLVGAGIGALIGSFTAGWQTRNHAIVEIDPIRDVAEFRKKPPTGG